MNEFSEQAVAEAGGNLERAIDAYLEDYEFEGDGGSHTPGEFERFVIKDAIMGLLVDEAFEKALTTTPATELADRYGSDDAWGEHPTHIRAAWQHEVAGGDTISSYWEWVASQIDQQEEQQDAQERWPSSATGERS